ncbi:ribonuclease H-like domain-containing protein [Xylaria sp. FL0933]|nr:ribonuclease H-like domain-containing protein [Xylaria sp. FL0933]
MPMVPIYKPRLTYDYHGAIVCFNHCLRVCGTCGVDYRGTGHHSRDENDDRVPVLGPGQNLFIPQWDEQVIGRAHASSMEKDYNDPPNGLTPDHLRFHYCDRCQLTWLDSDAAAWPVQTHPNHCTHHRINTPCSLVVFTDGACPFNGQANALNASIGVHFGYRSEYNISQRLNSDCTPTNQVAEIEAAVAALRQVRQTIEPSRRYMVWQSYPHVNEVHRRDIRRFRLIVATDSSYVVQCITKHIKNWTMMNGVYMNEQRKPVKNSDGFANLVHEVQELSKVGVQVVWYYVPREYNREADDLAKSALRSSVVFTGFAMISQ